MEIWLEQTIPLLSIAVPLIAGIFGWWYNERKKFQWEKHKRKEDRYRGFIESIQGFYVLSQDKGEKEKFIKELRLAWLYCPDEVIQAGNAFLDTVSTGVESSAEQKEQALAEFKIALRRDLYGKTRLTVGDHRIWSAQS
nr:hypothetical protein mgb_00014 [uncultured bacterium]